MGRYFAYRMHPLSTAELTYGSLRDGLIEHQPRPVDGGQFEALLRFGGFPEPFLRQETRFWNRWRRLRSQQLFKEDLRDLTRIQELGQVETLAELIRLQVGQLTSYTSLATGVNASVDSIRRWTRTLEALYYCFPVRPWYRNVARALRKEPKYYLWDWSLVDTPGARVENFVASALLKAVHLWTDHGNGDFGLFFIRDKEKREVDFVVVRDGRPWFLVEVKSSGSKHLSPALKYFQNKTGARHAFQLAMDLPFIERDCFEHTTPIIVPARTLLAQLV
jgi:predicted AAA+ superfamily ATPase